MAADFKRDPNGVILDYHGFRSNTPADRLPVGKYFYGQNLRRYLAGGTVGRSRQTAAEITLDSGSGSVHSLRRMNDSTPAGPGSGYVIIAGKGNFLFANANAINGQLSCKRVSIVPFRPNQSVQPWAYVADDNVMLKVRSDGTCYKDGLKEPQTPATAAFSGGGGTVIPGINGIQYKYRYRSSATGAVSNAGPASTAGTNTQSSSTKTLTGADLNTKVTFNGTQWEFVGVQLRLTGSVTNNAQLLDYVVGHNFGFAVPDGVDIDGITIDLNWLNQPGFPAGSLVNVALFYNNNIVGSVKSPGTASGSTSADATAGNAADTWGATLTPDIVNSNSFGFGVQIFENKGRLFLNSLSVTVYYSSQNAAVTPIPSGDPQVDKIDYYRFGKGLENYTYVGTGPNNGAVYTDKLDDLTAQANAILETDNFEPYPSLDLPRRGTLTAAGGVLAWVSGDTFNLRWLPGTVIVIAGVAYVSDRRPTSTIAWTMPDVPDGVAVTYEIAEPPLAQQCMRSQWGPTDNVAYMFACGDTLRPGTLYFTKGNNPDSAPDTNQIEVTSPSEPLQSGCIVSGVSMVFSTERAWLAIPNFFNALATVSGVEGSPFSLQLSITNRGLYARKGVCTDGGANVFFIGKDGIYVSPGGNGSRSITDDDLFNLFPHEGNVPANLVLGATGITLYAPDFASPDEMELSFVNGYLYFDYVDLSATRRTLVYDVAAGGWVVDVYQHPASVHATEEGRVEGVLVGCSDGTIRELSSAGTETGTVILCLPALNAGDARALKQWGDLFLEAAIPNAIVVTATLFDALYTASIAGTSPATVTGTSAARLPYVVDFASGLGLLAVDLGTLLSWPLGATVVYTWQPTFVAQPESTQNRPTDWDDAGTPAAKFVQGALITADTSNAAKALKVQRGDDLALFTPNESPLTFNGQSSQPITFTPPFVAHNMRLVLTDAVPWRLWNIAWAFRPYPESCIEWQSEPISHGLIGWQHIYLLNVAHISNAAITLVLTFDQGPVSSLTLAVPSSGGAFVKTKVLASLNKFKGVSYRAYSGQPFRLFLPDFEVHVKQWGSTDPYSIVRPFGGPASAGAEV